MKKIMMLFILGLCFIPSLSYAITCPAGSHYETDAYGPTCKTDQIVNSPNMPQSNIQTNSAGRICPYGSYLGKDAYGNQACLDSHTNQIVSSPSSSVQNNSSPNNSPPNSPFIWVGIVLMFVVFVLLKIFRRGSTTPQTSTYEPFTRRGWTELEKEEVRIRQDGKCNKCGRPPPRWEYHHRDGNRSNNSLRNCEGLCPNCHSVRTHDE